MSGEAAARLIALCLDRGLMIATAESCTGGLIAGALTGVAGSSAVVDRGFVTYSNEAKAGMLGVRAQTLAAFGAVSGETAAEMAEGALANSRAGLALSVTGIAGPGGATETKPVGLVWFGFALAGQAVQTRERRFGAIGRDAVRAAAVLFALEEAAGLVEALPR